MSVPSDSHVVAYARGDRLLRVRSVEKLLNPGRQLARLEVERGVGIDERTQSIAQQARLGQGSRLGGRDPAPVARRRAAPDAPFLEPRKYA